MKTKIILVLIVLLIPLIFAGISPSSDTPGVHINEVELNPAGNPDVDEWVEIHNDESPTNLSGWYITDRDNNKFFFPDSIIGLNGFFVLDSFPNNALVNTNENVSLYDSNNSLIDKVLLLSDSGNNNKTWSRVPDGTGSFVFQNGTKGFSNVLNGSIPPINITISERSVEPVCAFFDDEITLKTKVEGDCINQVIFSVEINGNWTDFSATKIAGIYTKHIPSGTFSESGSIDWKVIARDCYDRIQEDVIKTFTLHERTILLADPVNPNGLNNWYVSEPKFSLYNNEADNIWYEWDSSGIIHYAGLFGLEDIPNAPPIDSAGILELKWFSDACSDENGLNESESDKKFYVDLTNPIIKNLIPANNAAIINELRPEISAYIDEAYNGNSGINLSAVKLILDGEIITSDSNITREGSLDAKVNYKPSSDLDIGEHDVRIIAYDNAGRFTLVDWSFDIEEAGNFSLSVYSPEDISYEKKSVLFNITTADYVEKIEYINYNDKRPNWKILCRYCNEYIRNRNLNEGKNNITIRATDEYGQIEEKNISLFIDSKKPIIHSVIPTKNKFTNGNLFYIKYSEDNLEEVELFWNEESMVLNCSSGRKQECTTSIDLSSNDGEEIEFWFEVSDSINTVITKKTKVLVDTTSPILSINMPKNATYQRKVPINLSVSENVTIEYMDSWDERPEWRKLCSDCDNYGFDKEKTKSFRKGIHELIIKATDEAGNFDEDQVEFLVDY